MEQGGNFFFLVSCIPYVSLYRGRLFWTALEQKGQPYYSFQRVLKSLLHLVVSYFVNNNFVFKIDSFVH